MSKMIFGKQCAQVVKLNDSLNLHQLGYIYINMELLIEQNNLHQGKQVPHSTVIFGMVNVLIMLKSLVQIHSKMET